MSSARPRAAVIVATSLTLLVGAAPNAAAAPTIVGAGSTWSQIAIDQWRADVTRLGLSVNYQGVGSTSGRQLFAANTVDFAVSEIPFQPDDPPVHRAFAYLPIVAGGTSMMYNLKAPSGKTIRNLRLSPPTIAAIFTGKIRNWSDRHIKADYGHKLPNLPIKVIVRSDGSGTSAQFSAYIKAMEGGAWASFARACGIPNAFTSFWPYGRSNCLPNGIGQRGSDGVANYVANPGLGLGAIGYVEAGYAIARRFPVVAVKNASGVYTYPTAQNVARALEHARLKPDSTQELSGVYRAPERDAYPISSYSYMIVPTDDSISPDKGAVLGKFIIYFACQGQQVAEPLGYSPMPKPLVQFAFAAEKKIPGAPKPPAVTGKACPNPALTGEFYRDRSNPPPPGSEEVLPPESSDGPGTEDGIGPSGTTGSEGAVTGTTGSGSSLTDIVTATPEVLDAKALAELRRAADERIEGATLADTWPLVVAAIVVLIAIFAPLVLRLRNRQAER